MDISIPLETTSGPDKWNGGSCMAGNFKRADVIRPCQIRMARAAIGLSVRALADTYLVNPLTVARAYRELDEFTETRRGIGLIVKDGVRELLLKRERRKFLAEEWPGIRERIDSLEIDVKKLMGSD